MKIPQYIEFHNETNYVLSKFLMAPEPAEGCAILIGQKKISKTYKSKNFWEVKHIWNCRNVWGQPQSKLLGKNLSVFSHQKNIQSSKNNRFEIDAKDQIASQKWARNNDLEILCCAHSHPIGDNKPSKMDLFLHQAPGLMIISNKYGDLKAWWIKNKLNFYSVKIEILSLT